MAAPMAVLTLAGAAIAAAGVFLAVLAFRAPALSGADLVASRLDAYRRQAPADLLDEDVDERQPFHVRVVLPLLRRLAAVLARRTPEASRLDLQRRLNLAGRPFGLSAGEFLAVRTVAGGLGAVAGVVLALLAGRLDVAFFGVVLGALSGLAGPQLALARRVRRARHEIRLSLPDALDLMSVCVEAGLTFEGAMARVAERFDNALGAEFAQVMREIALGRPRSDAMADLGDRSRVDEMHSFAQAVIQSESLGTGIARILRIQSEEVRRRRRQRAQELGARAGLKMLFPMVAFIFPSLWIVLLGPAVLLLLAEFGAP